MKKGMIFVISGPSGSGKGTVVELLRTSVPELGVSVSATTRAPRDGEVDGVSYHYMTVDAFKALLDAGEVLEHTCYNGNYYGTLKSEAEKVLAEGRDLILEIEVEGALQVKSLMPEDAVAIMLIAPTPEEQERRLRGRGTETEEAIQGRLRRAAEEIALADRYDYVVVNENGGAEMCADEIKSIMTAEHRRYRRMKSLTDGYAGNK